VQPVRKPAEDNGRPRLDRAKIFKPEKTQDGDDDDDDNDEYDREYSSTC